MAEFAEMVNIREPTVDNVIGFVDGLSLVVQCSDNEYLQNAAYNGYSHDTSCNNVIAFSPEGKVIYCSYNYPGSWHDNTVAQDLINVVIERIGPVICAKCISPFDYSHKGVGVAAADSLSCSQLAMEKQTGSYID